MCQVIQSPFICAVKNWKAMSSTSAQWKSRTAASHTWTGVSLDCMHLLPNSRCRALFPAAGQAHPGGVLRDRADFAVVHAHRDAAHHAVRIVRARAGTKHLQLRLEVL